MKKLLFLASLFAMLCVGCDDAAEEGGLDDGVTTDVEQVLLSVDSETAEGENYGSKLSKNLIIDDTFSLSAIVTPSDATNTAVEWNVEGSSATFESGVVTAVEAGVTTITATSSADFSKSASITITVTAEPVEVSGIALYIDEVEYTETTTKSLYVGERFSLKAIVEPDDVTNPSYSWSVEGNDDGNISFAATDYTECEVVALKKDDSKNITITATAKGDDSYKASITLCVDRETTSSNNVSISDDGVGSVDKGTDKTITLDFGDTDYYSISWAVTDGSDYASIPDPSTGESVVVTTSKAGEATITATITPSEGAASFTKSYILTINEVYVAPDTATFTASTASIALNGTFTFAATPSHTDANAVIVTDAVVTWKVSGSSDSITADATGSTIDADSGEFTAGDTADTTYVLAMYGDTILSYCKVDVTESESISLGIDQTVDMSVTTSYTIVPTTSNMTDPTIDWTISLTGATVTDGVVTATAAGTYTITATVTNYNNISDSIDITFDNTNVGATSIAIDAITDDLYIDESYTLSATVTAPDYAPASAKVLTWTIKSGSAVTLDGSTITCVAAGTSTVTASAGGISQDIEITVLRPDGVELPDLGEGGSAFGN